MRVPMISVTFSPNDAYCEGYYYVTDWHFVKLFPICCDVLGMSYHFDSLWRTFEHGIIKSWEILMLQWSCPLCICLGINSWEMQIFWGEGHFSIDITKPGMVEYDSHDTRPK